MLRLTGEGRRPAFVMVYAVGTLVLISTLALSLMEATGADIAVARQRLYLVLARTAAESGIEYAMGFVDREIGRKWDPTGGYPAGGPWTDPFYFFEMNNSNPRVSTMNNPWMYAFRAGNWGGQTPPTGLGYSPQAGFPTPNQAAEGRIVRMSITYADGSEGTAPPTVAQPYAQVMQFQISMTPELNFKSVHDAAYSGRPTVFYIRSRGEVLYNDGTPGVSGVANGTVLASAYLVQTFYVPALPASSNQTFPRPVRLVTDREPLTLTVGPSTMTLSNGAVISNPQPKLYAPNPH